MIRRAFENRSGRVIALCRVALALSLLFVILIDKNQPARGGAFAYAGLIAYPVVSLVMLWIAWGDWYLDYRMRLPSTAIDIGVFLAAIWFTVRTEGEFASPFTAFFGFLLLAAISHSGWRWAMQLAVIVTFAYLIEGVWMYGSGIAFDPNQFVRRLVFNLVLGGFILWLGAQRRKIQPERPNRNFDMPFDALVRDLLAYAMRQTRATGGIFLWLPEDEPWTFVFRAGSAGSSMERLDPEDVTENSQLTAGAFLFDLERPYALHLSADYQFQMFRREGRETVLRDRLKIAKGLSVSLHSAVGDGVIILNGIRGVCPDHLELALGIGQEIEGKIERHAIVDMARSTEAAQIQDRLARDLHDSVAQSLAGANFRLGAVMNAIKAGHDPKDEIRAIQRDLRIEQHHVRSLIDRLRGGEDGDRMGNLSAQLHKTIADLARQWHVEIISEITGDLSRVHGWLIFEVQQIVREAVANAVRHGKARHIAITAQRPDGVVLIDITDDGTGFPESPTVQRPRSLSERVLALGGKLDVESLPGKTQIVICIPLGDHP